MGILISAFHYMIAIILLFILLPRLIFSRSYGDGLEQMTANMLKLFCLLVLIGYGLIYLRLFELLSLVFLFIWLSRIVGNMRRRSDASVGRVSILEALFYEYMDGQYRLREVFARTVHTRIRNIKDRLRQRFMVPTRFVASISIGAIVILTIYVSFSEVFTSTALTYLDSYQNLQWIKDIRQSELYVDGTISYGYHVLWSSVQEISRLDALHIMQFSGLLIRLLTLGGLYLAISRLTHHRFAGIAGMVAYGLWGTVTDSYYWEWQTVSSPITLAHALTLPALYFLCIYMRDGNRDAGWTWYAGLAFISLLHRETGVLLLILLFVISIGLKVYKRMTERISLVRIYMISSAIWVAGSIPLIIGWMLGRPFIQDEMYLILPEPSVIPLLLGAISGFAWAWLFRRSVNTRLQVRLEVASLLVILAAGMAGTWMYTTVPVKADWDAVFEQYGHIADEFEPRSWMIVAKQSLSAVVKGTGYHMNIDQFMKRYSPHHHQLTRTDDGQLDMDISPHVLLLMEKSIRPVLREDVHPQLAASQAKWLSQYEQLADWIDRYEAKHGQLPVYYEDGNIIIYHLERQEELIELETEGHQSLEQRPSSGGKYT